MFSWSEQGNTLIERSAEILFQVMVDLWASSSVSTLATFRREETRIDLVDLNGDSESGITASGRVAELVTAFFGFERTPNGLEKILNADEQSPVIFEKIPIRPSSTNAYRDIVLGSDSNASSRNLFWFQFTRGAYRIHACHYLTWIGDDGRPLIAHSSWQESAPILSIRYAKKSEKHCCGRRWAHDVASMELTHIAKRRVNPFHVHKQPGCTLSNPFEQHASPRADIARGSTPAPTSWPADQPAFILGDTYACITLQ